MNPSSGWEALGAVVFVAVMVLSPVGSAAAVSPSTAAAGPADVAPLPASSTAPPSSLPTASVPSDVDDRTDEATLDSGSIDPAKLSSAVKLRLARTNGSSTEIPVIVVLETQPDEAFTGQELAEAGPRELEAFAGERQQPLLDYLDDRRAAGEASDVRSFWVVNAIAVEATPNTILNLTRSDDVDEVVYDSPLELHGASGNSTISRIASRLSKYGNVTAVTPDGYEQSTTGDRVRGVEYIGADDVQERGVTGEGINVSVIDTGIDADHPALEDDVTLWKDFTDENSPNATDPIGHGTHVAGTVAGGPDSKYSTGVAPEANLFGARIFNSSEGSRLSWTLASFEWSAENGADVVQGSFGVPAQALSFSGGRQVEPSTTSSAQFQVARNATAMFETRTDLDRNVSRQLRAFKPAYVYVEIVPTAVNGTGGLNDSERAAAMRNLTVTLSNPQGQESLQRFEAGWWYQSDEVPDQIGWWKFKPGQSRVVEDGTWTLNVSSQHGENVSYSYQATPVYPTNGSDVEAEAANTLANQGVVPVFSAGNDGILGNRSMGTPGAASGTIAVGASMPETTDVAAFSSRGPVGYGAETRPGVDLVAPGVDVLSTTPLQSSIFGTQPDYDEAYGRISGTSMAAPHVSGVAALILDAAEDEGTSMGVDEVRSTLRNTSQPAGGPQDENDVGAGLLDAWAAVNATTDLAARQPTTEAGVHELHAGLGGTASQSFISLDLPGVIDPEGDDAGAPDLHVVGRDVTSSFGLATYGTDSPNATFEIYVDIDRNDSTGDADRRGAEYLLRLERTYFPGNESYDVTERRLAYNDTADDYEPTFLLFGGDVFSVQGNFLRISGIGIDAPGHETFEWHVVATDGSDEDTAPDVGQVAHPPKLNETGASGMAVAWNATAGAPDQGTPITFKLYQNDADFGQLLVNRTVTTDANGSARVALPANATVSSFELVVTDEYGNEIEQSIFVDQTCIEFCIVEFDPEGGGDSRLNVVEDREYSIMRNETLTLNIPVYNDTGSTLDPYTGNASVRLTDFDNRTTINDISVTDGVIRTTVDFSNRSIDENVTFLDIMVALRSDFSTAINREYAGYVEFGSGVGTSVTPFVQAVGSGEAAEFSFQHRRFRQNAPPVNASVRWETVWVTDRQIHAFYSDLPASTVSHIEEARREGVDGNGESPLTRRDGREIRQAAENLSELDASAITVMNGTAPPTRHGVGQFEVSPPADARYGFVYSAPAVEDESAGSTTNLVVVKDRVAEFERTRTEPTEDDEYFLSIQGVWDEYQDGDWILPNDTFDVRVSLYDATTGERVGGETVRLYSTAGETETVTTDANGDVVVTMSAPDIEWRTAGFNQERQQVLGLVDGLNDGDGTAVSDSETLFASAFYTGEPATDGGTRPDPDITAREDGRLRVDISYWNTSTFSPANGSRTLTVLGTPEALFGSTHRDIYVDYVDPAGETDVSFNVTDSSPPAPEEPRQYEVSTTTASLIGESGGTFWSSSEFVGGARVQVDAPSEISTGQRTTVTVTVTGRDGQPIEDAAVVWQYLALSGTLPSDGEGDSVDVDALDTPGESFVGVTDANGEVSFTFTPGLDSAGTLGFATGIATENVSLTNVPGGEGTIAVSEEPPVNVTGRLQENGGSAAAGDMIRAVLPDGPIAASNTTDADGDFALEVRNRSRYDLLYGQVDESASQWTLAERDGSVDLWPLDRIDTTGDESLGTTTLPEGHVVNVTVVDESGDPVEGARVKLYIENTADGVDLSTPWMHTRGDGMLYPTNNSVPGFELRDDVNVTVEPPADDPRFFDRRYVEDLQVTGARNVTVTLQEPDEVVSIESGETTVNATTALNLTLSSAPTGLSGYTINVSVEDGTIAGFHNASFPSSFGISNRTITDDGTTITLKAADLDNETEPGATDVLLAAVEVEGRATGETNLTVDVPRLDDDNGSAVAPRTTSGTINVTGIEQICFDPGCGIPTDPDGDGDFEDLDGNGRFGFNDVVVFFEHMDDAAVTDHPSAYDFNDNGRIDFDDIVTLFEEI